MRGKDSGVVQKAIRAIKKARPDLIVMADVCLCEYTEPRPLRDPRDGELDNDATLEISRARRSCTPRGRGHRRAERHDGRSRARDPRRRWTKTVHRHADHELRGEVCVGVLRAVPRGRRVAPAFGDRRSYQMDAANADEALREVALDIQEGADIVMVKPALAYLDLIHRVKTRSFPPAAYTVSGEYAMIKAAAANGLD